MNLPMAGGEKAGEAAKKLYEAAKDVQAQLDQKKGQEANDQAALQPNKVDANTTAQQLQKAIDQANTAAQKANEAAMNQPPTDKGMNEPGMPMKGQPNIAELQKEIAKQASDQKLAEAAKSADKAAEALEKGDIPNAIENQEKALDQLKQSEGMQPGEKGMQPGEKQSDNPASHPVRSPNNNSASSTPPARCSNPSRPTTPRRPPCSRHRPTRPWPSSLS
jgi:hypothetical protein